MRHFYRTITQFVAIGMLMLIANGKASAQGAQIVMDGAIISLANSAYLVIDNPDSTAITRFGGHIISEQNSNNVLWNIGESKGKYMVPFGFGSSTYLPVSFVKDSGAAINGSVLLSTYRTGWRNSAALPTGVLNMNGSGQDNSAFVLDRFWKVEFQNYTTMPTLHNLVFTYAEAELMAPNTIHEENLQAQRWNNKTSKWGDYGPAGTVNTVLNTVTIPMVAGNNMFRSWVLVDNGSSLPIELMTFEAKPVKHTAQLDWATAIEVNNDYFTLENSADGIDFKEVARVKGAGNSTIETIYQYIDEHPLPGTSYYRLKQTDFDGAFTYSDMRAVTFDEDGVRSGEETEEYKISVFPNPVAGGKFFIRFDEGDNDSKKVMLFDLFGKMIWNDVISGSGTFETQLNSQIAAGTYLLKVIGTNKQSTTKLVVL